MKNTSFEALFYQKPKIEALRFSALNFKDSNIGNRLSIICLKNENKQAVPMMQAKACTDGTSYIPEYSF